jgi:hypothetical protein
MERRKEILRQGHVGANLVFALLNKEKKFAISLGTTYRNAKPQRTAKTQSR